MSIRENTNRLLDRLRGINPGLFAGRDALEVLELVAKRTTDPHSPRGQLALDLREMAIRGSAVGSIEALMNSDGGIAEALRKSGLPTSETDERQLDREALARMNLRELEEFAGRLAIMVADALNPETQAQAIRESLSGLFVYRDHAIAARSIHPTMTHDYVLDCAMSPAITHAVEDAHEEIEDFLREGELERIIRSARTGDVSEDDSRKLSGIQVADVAAAFARDVVERCGKPTFEAATELKQYFDGVFLNTHWL